MSSNNSFTAFTVCTPIPAIQVCLSQSDTSMYVSLRATTSGIPGLSAIPFTASISAKLPDQGIKNFQYMNDHCF